MIQQSKLLSRKKQQKKQVSPLKQSCNKNKNNLNLNMIRRKTENFSKSQYNTQKIGNQFQKLIGYAKTKGFQSLNKQGIKQFLKKNNFFKQNLYTQRKTFHLKKYSISNKTQLSKIQEENRKKEQILSDDVQYVNLCFEKKEKHENKDQQLYMGYQKKKKIKLNEQISLKIMINNYQSQQMQNIKIQLKKCHNNLKILEDKYNELLKKFQESKIKMIQTQEIYNKLLILYKKIIQQMKEKDQLIIVLKKKFQKKNQQNKHFINFLTEQTIIQTQLTSFNIQNYQVQIYNLNIELQHKNNQFQEAQLTIQKLTKELQEKQRLYRSTLKQCSMSEQNYRKSIIKMKNQPTLCTCTNNQSFDSLLSTVMIQASTLQTFLN